MSRPSGLTCQTATAADLEALVAIRIEAMRASLEQIGRFDPERARQRFVEAFCPALTTKLLLRGELAGFFVVRRHAAHLSLEHLYLRPACQGLGVGSHVLAGIQRGARVAGLPIRLGALRDSPANAFYLAHGFVVTGTEEWDIFYTFTPPPGATGILQTARLALCPVQPSHAEHFVAFYGDPAVMAIRKYGVMTSDQARTQVATMTTHWQVHGFGMWSIWLPSLSAEPGDAGGQDATANPCFAGECGLRWLEDGSEVELSYGLTPAARGRGLATEAAAAALEHAFERLGLARVVALSRGDNRISHRVLEKLGMTLAWRRAQGEHGLVRYELEATGA